MTSLIINCSKMAEKFKIFLKKFYRKINSHKKFQIKGKKSRALKNRKTLMRLILKTSVFRNGFWNSKKFKHCECKIARKFKQIVKMLRKTLAFKLQKLNFKNMHHSDLKCLLQLVKWSKIQKISLKKVAKNN